MNVCPFCTKAAVIDPQTPCRACGRRADDHASAQSAGGRTLGGGWDDGDELGGLDLTRGGAIASDAGPSAYAGGGLSLGDDDPFADDVPQGILELDLPASHTAKAPRSVEPEAASSAPPSSSGGAATSPAHGVVPDLVLPARHQSTPSTPAVRPHPSGASMPAVRPHPSGASMPAVRPHPSGASMPAVRPHPSGASMPAERPLPNDPSAPPYPSDASLPAPPSDPHLPPGLAPPGMPPGTPAARRPVDPAAAMIARYPAVPDKVWEAPGYALRVLWRQLELRQDLTSLRRRRSPDVPLYERALRARDPKTFALGLAITCAALAIASFVFFLPVILRFLRAPD